MLTQEESDDLERIQKNVVRMILSERFSTYEEGLELLGLESLRQRREQLCLSFALKCCYSAKYKDLFQLTSDTEYNLREERKKFVEHHCNSERFKKSPLMYLTRILNDYFENHKDP